MTMLTITRGLPASGKTTWARSWVDSDPLNRARVNRDDLRFNLHGKYTGLDYKQEERVTEVQRASVTALIQSGVSVVVDDTNLRLKHARAWVDLAVSLGVDWEVRDFPHSAAECLTNDLTRGIEGGRRVGAKVIHDFATRYKQPWPEVLPSPEVEPAKPELYVRPEGKPEAFIFDIDGTLATNDGHRGWYEWDKVGGDAAKEDVALLAWALQWHCNAHIIVMSGRDEVCREQTEKWLYREGVPITGLFMRPEGDNRRDDVVKLELFDKHVRDNFQVLGVFDDRNSVVAMWRALGLTCYQVADGDF